MFNKEDKENITNVGSNRVFVFTNLVLVSMFIYKIRIWTLKFKRHHYQKTEAVKAMCVHRSYNVGHCKVTPSNKITSLATVKTGHPNRVDIRLFI